MPQIQLDATLFATAFVTVLVIRDPLGNVPIFLSLTRGHTLSQQRRAALPASTVAGGVILSFALFGQHVLVVYLSMRYAGLLGRLLRDNGIDLLSRVMGLLVAAIAVQLVASAVESWVRSGVS